MKRFRGGSHGRSQTSRKPGVGVVFPAYRFRGLLAPAPLKLSYYLIHVGFHLLFPGPFGPGPIEAFLLAALPSQPPLFPGPFGPGPIEARYIPVVPF